MRFEEVYERFRGPVWRLARRLTGSDDEALDASQEIFMRVWRGLPGFRGHAKLSTWVFQIAWNYLRLHHRRRSRLVLVDDPPCNDGPAIIDTVVDQAADPERQAAGRQLVERVERELARLPEHYRVALWLRDGEGLSYNEIAHALEIPVGTVRSRIARARAALKEACDQ